MTAARSKPTFSIFPELQRSLQLCGREEANRFKWIRSEQAGYDLGDPAIREWIYLHWNGFLRHAWLEHLQGKVYWLELQETDFGLLQREFQNSPLLNPILDRLIVLKENLDIILWAQEVFTRDQMDEVIDILEALNVNACRLKCEFEPDLQRALFAVA
ncbi:hypothetical protein OJF2_18880 [Aquisphaera giovannonii]|uniref:Uncharacterized protein n=1 Tax=Aquisphaera giovannonii TaxID=406548 RepID=A0A5B9VZJ7_9BACT|nr:hypothetical protein [Aquisphaera giovannonii]QEH33387.1 hypothetical protein OJF2_18880 [Aquisphaera giovannonii]